MDQRIQPADASAAGALRVYIVEDAAHIVERLVGMFDAIEGVSTVGCATGAQEAIHGIRAAAPDVVFLDIRLAQGSGFDVLRSIRATAPAIDVFMLSNFASEPYRQLAAKLGARGFFDKSTEFEQMRRMLAACAHGHRNASGNGVASCQPPSQQQ